MPIRNASAVWNGTLKEGAGIMKLGSGAFEGAFSHATRFGETPGTNPEELIGAAHAGCFSMFLSALLTKAGYTPTSINTSAKVHLGDGPTITLIALETEAVVPTLTEEVFQEKVDEAKKNCPISKALASVPLSVDAKLVG
jgi:osmotically inducible protein OsmC